jgi:ankyrin repeat protein
VPCSWSPKRYASNYFWKHALLAKEKGFIVDLAMAVFSSQRPWKLQVDRRTTQLLWSECDLCRRHDEDYNAGRESRTSTLSLRYPSRTGLARVTEKLLHEWPNIDRHGRRWSSALVKSSKLGYYNIVKLLVEAGCDYNAKVPHQDFDVASRDIGAAVEFAAYEGHAKIVQTPGRVWWERREMRRCVGSSSAGSCEDTVRVIIDSYSAKHSPNPPYQKALLAAALAPNSTDTREILKVLVDAVSREAPKNVLLESPEILEKAVLRRDGGRVRTLCELGANINAIDGTGQSLLHFAADRPTWRDYAGGVSVIIALIYLGLGVNAEDHYGETPSHKSCISEDNEEREKS